MRAKVGDWLVMKGTNWATRSARTDQRGALRRQLAAICGALVDHRTTSRCILVPDAIVVTPEEQEEADERARGRLAAMQADHTTSEQMESIAYDAKVTRRVQLR